jgi:hypothetical protein
MHGTLSQPLPHYTRIVAFDLGKFNSVLCRFDPATAGHAFVSLATDRHITRRGPSSINQLRIINRQLLITRSNE